jgi:preprotein translocase subunit SecD
MRNTLALWLTAIIVMTLGAMLYVFKPIALGTPRRDPVDAHLWLRPVGVEAKGFLAEMEPTQPFFTIPGSNTPVFLYVPQFDLKLGLDLRGGMRVTLEIPNRAEFTYPLGTALADAGEASKRQVALTKAIEGKAELGDPNTIQISVTETKVSISTQPKTKDIAVAQLKVLNAAMASVFPDGKFDSPSEDRVFKLTGTLEQDSVRQIMERRLNAMGTTEVTSQNKGTDQVVLEIPGVKDPEQVERMLGKTAQMEFRLIPQGYTVSVDDETGDVTASHNNAPISAEEMIKAAYLVLPGSALKPNSDVATDPKHPTGVAVSFSFEDRDDRAHFAEVTGGNVGKQLAIVLDGKIITAPTIESKIEGDGIITGNRDAKAAKELAVMLNAGALPVPVTTKETRVVSPTLGADSVSRSLFAGLIGLALVLLFMGIYYRLPGLMADLALVVYICLSLAVLKFFNVTLTLPGFAGIIISIGMAVDANVIIFERLKEELRTQKPLETAIEVAFSRAWTAILDSNVASLITGAVLAWLGTGAVRGFAITLIIGVVVSLFTAVTVTRLFLRLMVRSHTGHVMAWYGL